uniref:Uncharacterized protein n=1 Tax=Knipowitschia caucasica TaxID=637954 RepID=A0AAV2KU46_KNICA
MAVHITALSPLLPLKRRYESPLIPFEDDEPATYLQRVDDETPAIIGLCHVKDGTAPFAPPRSVGPVYSSAGAVSERWNGSGAEEGKSPSPLEQPVFLLSSSLIFLGAQYFSGALDVIRHRECGV